MWPKAKFNKNFQILFCKMFKNRQHYVKVQAERFHLNGHSIGFRLHSTQNGRVTLQNSIIRSGSERVNNPEL